MSASGLNAVFLAQRPMLLRMLTARLGKADDAEDVVQDMWLKLERGTSGPVSDPAAYLFRMATNLATDRRVSAVRRVKRDDEWNDMRPGDSDYPDAERALVAANELSRVKSALAAMPERMARALLLFRVEERPQREIAHELGISVSGVEKLLRRGYKQLTERLSENGAGPGQRHRLKDEGNDPHD